jgi:hypothetical protein
MLTSKPTLTLQLRPAAHLLLRPGCLRLLVLCQHSAEGAIAQVVHHCSCSQRPRSGLEPTSAAAACRHTSWCGAACLASCSCFEAPADMLRICLCVLKQALCSTYQLLAVCLRCCFTCGPGVGTTASCLGPYLANRSRLAGKPAPHSADAMAGMQGGAQKCVTHVKCYTFQGL